MSSSCERWQCIRNSLELGDAPSQVTAITFNKLFSHRFFLRYVEIQA